MTDPLSQLFASRRAVHTATRANQPAALRPVREDPAYTRALQVKQAYLDSYKAIQAAPDLSDIGRAALIVRTWREVNAELDRLGQDLQARRKARLTWLESVLPVGPGIPDDTTAADRAVLMQAWNTNLEKARAARMQTAGMSEGEMTYPRYNLLTDAFKYGDDLPVRAVLTVCIEQSDLNTLNRWVQNNAPDIANLITEYTQLSKLYAGDGWDTELAFQVQALQPIPRPVEAAQLPQMVKAANAATDLWNRSNIGPNVVKRPMLDLEQLIAEAR